MDDLEAQRASATEAVILMAGVGSRLGGAGGALAKPLVQIAGRPLISFTFEAFERAGVRTVHAVMGANHELLTEQLRPLVPPTMRLNCIVNPEWQKQNGVSVLAATRAVSGTFFLAMGDHLFDFSLLDALITSRNPAPLLLAVDRKIDSIFDLDDAMKVRTENDQIVAIAKDLEDYDATDTGLFLCSHEIFSYLQRAKHNGDCSLADGVRLMAADGKAHVVDIADGWWQDVDTPEMLARAERESARLLRQDRSRRAEESVPSKHGTRS